MPRLVPLCAWLYAFALLVGCAVTPVSVAAAPAKLQGRWQVIQVAVDAWDQPHWSLSPDDPRMMGRLLTIDRMKLQLGNGSPACKDPKFTALPAAALQSFIGKNYRRPPAPEMPPFPTLKNFGLRLRNVAVTPLQMRCTPHNAYWSSWAPTWLVLTDDRLLIGKRGTEYLLVLRRVNPRAPIHASFNCAKASAAVERTICSSRVLAGYDRSVAAAYRGRLLRSDKPRAVIQQTQRQWLKQRDACGASVACLEKVMRGRVNQLVQAW